MRFVLEELGTDEEEYCRKKGRGREVNGVIRSHVNFRSLQLAFGRGLYEGLLVTVISGS